MVYVLKIDHQKGKVIFSDGKSKHTHNLVLLGI